MEDTGLNVRLIALLRQAQADQQAMIGRLRESFGLRPELKQWARQDSDLETLRGDPEYRAIFAE